MYNGVACKWEEMEAVSNNGHIAMTHVRYPDGDGLQKSDLESRDSV